MAWGVTPAIRTRDIGRLLAFYEDVLGFEVRQGTAEEGHVSLTRGEGNHLMLESAANGYYSAPYNAAIRSRVGSAGAVAFYVEAPDVVELHARALEGGANVVDPLADRGVGAGGVHGGRPGRELGDLLADARVERGRVGGAGAIG